MPAPRVKGLKLERKKKNSGSGRCGPGARIQRKIYLLPKPGLRSDGQCLRRHSAVVKDATAQKALSHVKQSCYICLTLRQLPNEQTSEEVVPPCGGFFLIRWANPRTLPEGHPARLSHQRKSRSVSGGRLGPSFQRAPPVPRPVCASSAIRCPLSPQPPRRQGSTSSTARAQQPKPRKRSVGTESEPFLCPSGGRGCSRILPEAESTGRWRRTQAIRSALRLRATN